MEMKDVQKKKNMTTTCIYINKEDLEIIKKNKLNTSKIVRKVVEKLKMEKQNEE